VTPPKPLRLPCPAGGHKVKVSTGTGLVRSHRHQGKHCDGVGEGPGTEEEEMVMTETRFRKHQDVAAVEHDEAGSPAEGGEARYGTVTEARTWSVIARIDGVTRYFLVDSRGRAWMDAGRWRLVPVCDRAGCDRAGCDRPVLGEPITDPDDPMGREWCSEDCLTAEAEAWHEQHYRPGVAT
jgi:hypothetical protein